MIQLPVDPRQIGAEASSQEVRDFISSERCDLCADDAPLSSVPLDSTSSYPPAAVLLAYRLFHYIGTQKFEVRYLLRLQNLMPIIAFPLAMPDTIFSLYHVAKFTGVCLLCSDNL